MPSTAERYRYWRQHDLTASVALSYVRTEERYAAILARFEPWEFTDSGYGTFARADMAVGDLTVRVLVGEDDAPVDWGDCEPTDAERDNASAFYVAVQVLDGDDELYHDGIGGVDVIDLPGYLQRDWEDAAAYALDNYLLRSAEDFARREPAERAEWEARDVVTT
jgi:hypothetical protein